MVNGQASTALKALDYALAYARRGWPVLPLHRPGNPIRGKLAKGTEAATARGFYDATTDAQRIQAWYAQDPQQGVGIVPGGAGLLALDPDTKDGKQGPEQLQALQDRLGVQLPQTLVQRTPSGAAHLMFRLPEGTPELGNSVLPDCPHVDIRAHKGYIAAEGTATAAGEYQWLDWCPLEDGDPEIADAPQWLVDLLVQINTAMQRPVSNTQALHIAPALMQAGQGIDIDSLPSELRTLVRDGVREGQRSDQFHHTVGWLKDRGYTLPQVVELLHCYPLGIAAKFAGRLQQEVERCWAKLKRPEVEPARGHGAADTEHLTKHALAQFVDIAQEVRPPKMIVPDLIQEGLVALAGQPGAGKTTAVVPLMLRVAGIGDPTDPLMPRHWRYVVYIAEDTEQVQRVLIGACQYGDRRWDMGTVRERFHLVQARRMSADDAVTVGPLYRERFTRNVDGVELLPVVVMDTRSAVLAIDDENHNGAASETIATLRQRFEGIPTIVIGHMARGALDTVESVKSMGIRGASAWEGDVEQTIFLAHDETGDRYLVPGKTRFEGALNVRIVTRTHKGMAQDEWGDWVPLTLRWCERFEPVSRRDREQQQADAKAQAEVQANTELRAKIFEAVAAAFRAGTPLTKSALTGKVRGHATTRITACRDVLLSENWLVEIPIPTPRANNAVKSYLISLDAAEREAYLRGEPLPPEKVTIPASLRRPETAIPVVPKQDGTAGELDATAREEVGSPLIPNPVDPFMEGNAGTSGMGLEAPNSVAPSQVAGNDLERAGTTGNEREAA
jgi:hypothetical protein